MRDKKIKEEKKSKDGEVRQKKESRDPITHGTMNTYSARSLWRFLFHFVISLPPLFSLVFSFSCACSQTSFVSFLTWDIFYPVSRSHSSPSVSFSFVLFTWFLFLYSLSVSNLNCSMGNRLTRVELSSYKLYSGDEGTTRSMFYLCLDSFHL